MALTDTIREALEGHQISGDLDFCECGAELVPGNQDESLMDPDGIVAHQAEAVAAALTKGGCVEWGTGYPTGGTFISIQKHSSEESARWRSSLAEYKHPATISRVVGPWERAE